MKKVTEQEFTKMVMDLIENNNVLDSIEKKTKKLYNSGALDISTLKKGNYIYPKAVLSVILQDLAFEFKPFSVSVSEKELENLSKFL